MRRDAGPPGAEGGFESGATGDDGERRREVFEIVFYNQEVCDALADGEHHPYLDDAWAERRYEEVRAADEIAARAMVENRHPPDHGFVIAEVTKSRY